MPVVLVDTGPLVAILDKSDDWHQICRKTLETLRDPLLTVWPVMAEASYLLRASIDAQSRLMNWIQNGSVRLANLDRDDVPRIRELMLKYRDLPMDLADAAIVRVAERERINRVFTIDQKDFRVYRPAHIRHFTLLPATIPA